MYVSLERLKVVSRGKVEGGKGVPHSRNHKDKPVFHSNITKIWDTPTMTLINMDSKFFIVFLATFYIGIPTGNALALKP